MSCFYENFALPYINNLDIEELAYEDKFSDKHKKLSGKRIRLVITPLCKGQCITKLVENKEVENIGIAELAIERMSADIGVFILGNSVDEGITSKIIKDFKTADKGKYEDAFYIGTANKYKLPIITSEVRDILLWKKYCKNKVINHKKFWGFVDTCDLDDSKFAIKKKFVNYFKDD